MVGFGLMARLGSDTHECGCGNCTKETFFLKAYGHNQCCHLCLATKFGQYSYQDHRPTAAWRATCVTSKALFAARLVELQVRSPYTEIPGFSHLLIAIDDMHACDQGLYGLGAFRAGLMRACGLDLCSHVYIYICIYIYIYIYI
jgi:hypothetical protein